MGCHTWYRKPLVKGKENVQKYLRDRINSSRENDWWDEECEQEALISLKAIDALDEHMDEQLLEYVCIDNTLIFIDGEPQIFIKADGFDTDEPRIGGYPDTIIKSADEMFKDAYNQEDVWIKDGIVNELISQKISLEKWRKKLRHEIIELESNINN